MKIDILIVDLVLLALVLLPYVIFTLYGTRSSAKFKKAFDQIASQNAMTKTEIESWNFNILGLDKDLKKLLLVRLRNGEIKSEILELKSLKSCSIITETQNRKLNGKSEEQLKRVSLEFTYSNAKDNKILRLYDHELNIYQDYELKRAQQWHRRINDLIVSRPLIERAA